MVASFRLHPTFDGSGDAIRVEHFDKTPKLFRQRFAEQRAVMEGV